MQSAPEFLGIPEFYVLGPLNLQHHPCVGCFVSSHRVTYLSWRRVSFFVEIKLAVLKRGYLPLVEVTRS
jgi:hypothetical protein